MANEIDELIRQDAQLLVQRTDQQSFLPGRLKGHLSGQRPKSRRLQMIIWAWVSLYCMILSLLTFGHLSWIPSLEKWKKQEQAYSAVVLNPQSAELEKTISRAFLEVTRWGE